MALCKLGFIMEQVTENRASQIIFVEVYHNFKKIYEMETRIYYE
jgi:hypothetical protein